MGFDSLIWSYTASSGRISVRRQCSVVGMKASEVSEIVEREIDGNWSLSNAHGVNLQKCLIAPPVKRVYEDSFKEGEALEMWLVLEEIPEDKTGYKIVFDEESGMFGLAISGKHDNDVFIGFYGTFLETLEGM